MFNSLRINSKITQNNRWRSHRKHSINWAPRLCKIKQASQQFRAFIDLTNTTVRNDKWKSDVLTTDF